jgi:hypothetical protein
MLSGRFTFQFVRDCDRLGTVIGKVRKLVRTVRHPIGLNFITCVGLAPSGLPRTVLLESCRSKHLGGL